jgi:hypothetical protein
MNWGNHLDHPSASATKRAGAASRRAGRGGRRRYQPGWMPVSAASGRRTMASGSPVRAARPIEPQTSKSAKPDQASKTIQQSRRAPATTASGFSPRMLPRVGGRRAAFRRTAGEAWQGRLVACCAGTMQRPLSPDEPRQHRRFLRGAQKLMHRNKCTSHPSGPSEPSAEPRRDRHCKRRCSCEIWSAARAAVHQR